MPTGQVIRGLGGTAGFGELALGRSDDGAFQIDATPVFDDGLTYFGNAYSGDQLWVGTNGVLSFGTGLEIYPSMEAAAPIADFIAPFWADVDTRLDGEGAESGPIWIDLDTTGGHLTITWEDVGSYRRQADLTNLFQLRLTDQGNGNFDIRFAYERIDWTTGTLDNDAGAWAGLSAVRLPTNVALSVGADALATTAGNTGQAGSWLFQMRDGAIAGFSPVDGATFTGDEAGNVLTGGAFGDIARGYGGNDILRGHDGDDWLYGGDGADTLNGGNGHDVIEGGDSDTDLRDVIYAGAGDDTVDAGYGNDLIYGDTGNDVIEGGFGVDELIGQGGDDVLSGGAWSDLIYGGDGADFLNGGFGFDRVNGGDGADRFFHLGIPDHGSDWVQDYDAAEGDVLVWGQGAAVRDDFVLNFAYTANTGASHLAEAFITYRDTGQIIWALVDGGGQQDINIRAAGETFDIFGY